jgi:hypothetical protein
LRQIKVACLQGQVLFRRSEYLGRALAHAGAIDRVLDTPKRNLRVGSEYWVPLFAPLRGTERFKAYSRKVGLVDYWRAKGWPDLCHPTTGNDFECS